MAKRDLDLERKWKLKFDEYKKSGQSIKAWCKNNGIIHTTFRYWIKRFTPSEEFPPVDTQFAKVMLEPNCTNNKNASTTCEAFSKAEATKEMQTQSYEFQVFINNIRVIVPVDFSPIALVGLMKVLKTL